MAGQKAPTGPRKARPDDQLRAVFAPEVPAIHVFSLHWPQVMDARVKPAHNLSTVIAGFDPATHEAAPQ